jgi:glycerol-3-phosphate dehydrogenase
MLCYILKRLTYSRKYEVARHFPDYLVERTSITIQEKRE